MSKRTCIIEDCDSPTVAKGRCNRHYKQLAKPLSKRNDMIGGLPQRIWDKINMRNDSGCWIWTGGKGNATGYGRVKIHGRAQDAHRGVYELLMGTVPPGLELDHLCRVRLCVNPDHLEPVTHHVNLLRGVGASATNARRTHCPNMHPYNAVVTRSSGLRVRGCTICARENLLNNRAAKRAGLAAHGSIAA